MGATKGVRRSTEAYKSFKDQIEALWNFAVMICYAVPTLKKNIKAVEEAIPNYSIPKNDLFSHDDSTPEQLKLLAADYKHRLTAYLWLSSFSFFEAYVSGALRELFDAYAHRADRRDAEGQKAFFAEDTRFERYARPGAEAVARTDPAARRRQPER